MSIFLILVGVGLFVGWFIVSFILLKKGICLEMLAAIFWIPFLIGSILVFIGLVLVFTFLPFLIFSDRKIFILVEAGLFVVGYSIASSILVKEFDLLEDNKTEEIPGKIKIFCLSFFSGLSLVFMYFILLFTLYTF